MTFQEQLQQAADAGHRQKIEDDRAAACARVAAEERRLAAEIEASAKLLQALPERMRDAARRGRTSCDAHSVAWSDIDLASATKDRRRLQATSLKGVSLRIFDALEEMKLSPQLTLVGPNEYQIEVPVLPPTADAQL